MKKLIANLDTDAWKAGPILAGLTVFSLSAHYRCVLPAQTLKK
jgi:hypothetical protein